jgi:hypothetical protein
LASSAGEHPENRNPYPCDHAHAVTRKQEDIMKRCTKFMLAGIMPLGLAVVALPRAGFAQSDPFIGTWQLNLAKSKFSPGPGPKSATMNVQGEGENNNVTFAGINAEGNRQSLVLTWLYDGMPHAVTANTEANRLGLLGQPNIDARAFTRVDAYAVNISYMKAGKVVQTATAVVSRDGKTETITSTGTDANGQPINNVIVWDKQ